MNILEKLLNITIFVSLGVIIFYSVKCIFPRLKIKENFESKVQYCINPIYTAPGSEVTIRPVKLFTKYLSIDTNSSKDNVILNSISLNSWKLERVSRKIVKKNSLTNEKNGFDNNFSKPFLCSVYIKSELKYDNKISNNNPNSLNYYLTRKQTENFVPGVGNSHVSASLFGDAEMQVWYIIDIHDLPTDGLYKDIIRKNNKPNYKDTRFVFIVNNPTAFVNPNELSKTQFLTANIAGNDKYSIGAITLLTEPTDNSIWRIDLKIKGTIESNNNYKPISAIGEYPNNDNKEHGVFMNTFLPAWNRTWYSSSNNKLKSFTVNIVSNESDNSNGYSVKLPYATGTVTFDNIIYNVKSYGSDMLSSINYPSNDKSIIYLKMVPNINKPKDENGKYLIQDGMPMLQGWIEKPTTTGEQPNIISICASDNDNLTGVCLSTNNKDNLSTNNTDSFQKFLVTKDYLPINSDINFNSSISLMENFDTWENKFNYNKTPYPTLGNLKKCL